jgi:hypothetical protein
MQYSLLSNSNWMYNSNKEQLSNIEIRNFLEGIYEIP